MEGGLQSVGRKRKFEAIIEATENDSRASPIPSVAMGEEDEETREANRQRYEEQLEAMKKQRMLLDEGTSPEFIAYCADYKARLRREIEVAKKHEEWQIESTKQLCEYELKAAEEIFEFSKKELKKKMIESVDEEIKRLEALRDGEDEETGKKRSLRIAKPKEDAPNAANSALKISDSNKIRGNADGGLLNWTLDEDEIKNDIVSVATDWIEQSQKFKSKNNPVKCRFDRNKLYVGDNGVFEKGSCVIITSAVTRSDFYGTITVINPTELYIKTSDGSRSRVYLSHIHEGRVLIKEDTECFR